MDMFTVSVPVPDPGGDNKQLFLYQAPTDALGGGVRVLSASAVNGAATSGGTSFTYALHKYSSAGTPAVNGTICAAVGGSADEWASGVPKALTVTAAYAFLDAGEWLVLDYQEENAGNPTNSHLTVHLQMGK